MEEGGRVKVGKVGKGGKGGVGGEKTDKEEKKICWELVVHTVVRNVTWSSFTLLTYVDQCHKSKSLLVTSL